MSGYCGYSMSWNAVSAYNEGEKPMSKWTKTAVLEAIEKAINEQELTLICDIEKLKKCPAGVLKRICLTYSSWHHTSKYYNQTEFYSIDTDALETLTDEEIDKAVEDFKFERDKNKDKDNPIVEERWQCEYLEWSGTRKHPKSTVMKSDGIVRNGWFYLPNGHKKKTTANGFRFLKRLD